MQTKSVTAPSRVVIHNIIREEPSCEVNEFFPRRTRYAAAVVVLNEGERLKAQLQRMKPLAGLVDIIIADGHSNDGSTEPAFLASNGIRVLLNTSERGAATATRMAIAYAMDQGYEGLITLDGNGKDGVDAIPAFIQALDEGYDLIQGSRFKKGGYHENTPPERYFGIRWIMAPIIAIGCGYWYTDPPNAFRAMSMRFLVDPRVQPLRKIFVKYNVQLYLISRAARLGYKIKELPVSRVYPDDGPVPTKVIGWKGKFRVLYETIMSAFGAYDVSAPSKADR
jgi:dolichol-phosphate mannosyltransferase